MKNPRFSREKGTPAGYMHGHFGSFTILVANLRANQASDVRQAHAARNAQVKGRGIGV